MRRLRLLLLLAVGLALAHPRIRARVVDVALGPADPFVDDEL